MTEKYVEPSIDIRKFIVEDVITLSNDDFYVEHGEMGENVVQDGLP